jgi:RimJ/RimL family protein N-acetyltransferase
VIPPGGDAGAHPEIITPRLRLRRARPEDAEDLHAVFADPEVMRYWSTLAHADLAATRDWVADMVAADPSASDDYVIEYRGAAVGKAGCWRLPEVGYILRRDLWGRGLAREALSAIIPRVFASHPIAAITADVDPRNTASLGLLGRLGFVETHRASRTWLVGEEWCDSVYLSLPRPA